MSELQHPLSRSFEDVAELYERTRPLYPDEAVDWLCEQLRVGTTSTVLDLGAGTGKLTRMLLPRAARVIAVEPGPEMLAQLQRAVPQAEALPGAAEAIPLPDDAVDAIFCGQAFHWFRVDEALVEMRRVLRRGGIGLIWNLRHPNDELQNVITKLIAPFVPEERSGDDPSVEGFVHRTFPNGIARVFAFEEELDADGVADRIASISFVAAAPESERRRLERELRSLVDDRGGSVPFRYLTEAYAVLNVA